MVSTRITSALLLLASSACGADGPAVLDGADSSGSGLATTGDDAGSSPGSTASAQSTSQASGSTSSGTAGADGTGSSSDDSGGDPCMEVDCGAHGSCVVAGGAPRCECADGFYDVELTCLAGVDLTIEFVGDGVGAVEVAGNSCEVAPCTFEVPPATPLVATAVPRNNLHVLTAWSDACEGQDLACAFEIEADARVTARFDLAGNIAFVSSIPFTVAELQALPGVNVTAKADTWCTEQAVAAGWHGASWVAWLGSPALGGTLAERLGSARAWIRPDGRAVADERSDILAGALRNPILFDETGARRPVVAWSGLDLGGVAAEDCDSWTVTEDSQSAAAGFSGSSRFWAAGLGPSCDASHHIYCFGVDGTEPLPTPPESTGRLAFQTVDPFTLASGRAAADALCQTEADAAGLPGTYLAALSTSTEAYHERFDLGGPTWVRPDGQPLFDQAADLATAVDGALTSLHLHADGSVPALGGARPYTTYGSCLGLASRCCQDWTTDQGSTGVQGQYDLVFTDFATSVPCDGAQRIFCLQE